MTAAVGTVTSQVAALAVTSAPFGAAVTQLAALVVYAPPAARITRDSQNGALVPYAMGVYALPRTTQLAALIVYGTGTPDDKRSRAWTYTLDGHTFYVLNMAEEGTFLFDSVTQQWCQFLTDGYSNQWNMMFGTMWGNRIVGGDSITGQLWELEPKAVLDEGWRDLSHTVTGIVPTRARTFISCEALRIAASIGLIDEVNGATMNMRFSDDNGQTWSGYFSVTLTSGNTNAEVAWRSLGSFMSPGRVFELSDTGGLIRIDGCDVFLGDFDEKPQPGGG